MAFLKRMLSFSLVYIGVVGVSIVLLLLLAEMGLVSTPLMVVYLIAIILITIKFANYYWAQGCSHIWHIPISQVMLYGLFALFLFVRDLLGFRESASFFDLGVEFEIFLVVALGGIWIVPSILISIWYFVMSRRFASEYPDANSAEGETEQ